MAAPDWRVVWLPILVASAIAPIASAQGVRRRPVVADFQSTTVDFPNGPKGVKVHYCPDGDKVHLLPIWTIGGVKLHTRGFWKKLVDCSTDDMVIADQFEIQLEELSTKGPAQAALAAKFGEGKAMRTVESTGVVGVELCVEKGGESAAVYSGSVRERVNATSAVSGPLTKDRARSIAEGDRLLLTLTPSIRVEELAIDWTARVSCTVRGEWTSQMHLDSSAGDMLLAIPTAGRGREQALRETGIAAAIDVSITEYAQRPNPDFVQALVDSAFLTQAAAREVLKGEDAKLTALCDRNVRLAGTLRDFKHAKEMEDKDIIKTDDSSATDAKFSVDKISAYVPASISVSDAEVRKIIKEGIKSIKESTERGGVGLSILRLEATGRLALTDVEGLGMVVSKYISSINSPIEQVFELWSNTDAAEPIPVELSCVAEGHPHSVTAEGLVGMLELPRGWKGVKKVRARISGPGTLRLFPRQEGAYEWVYVLCIRFGSEGGPEWKLEGRGLCDVPVRQLTSTFEFACPAQFDRVLVTANVVQKRRVPQLNPGELIPRVTEVESSGHADLCSQVNLTLERLE